MNKWYAHGNVIELPDYDYYNQWIGTIISTNYLGGLLGGYFDKLEKNSNILEIQAEFLHENINLVKDKAFRNLLNDFEAKFNELIDLDKEVITILAGVLGLEVPKESQDYKTLHKKLVKERRSINANGLFSHPAFDKVRQRFSKIQEQQVALGDKVISYILVAFPDLASSEYLSSRKA
jgi:hypothetical protein